MRNKAGIGISILPEAAFDQFTPVIIIIIFFVILFSIPAATTFDAEMIISRAGKFTSASITL